MTDDPKHDPASFDAGAKAQKHRDNLVIAGLTESLDETAKQLEAALDTLALAQRVMKDQTTKIEKQATRIKELESGL